MVTSRDPARIKAMLFDLYFRCSDLYQMIDSASELLQNPLIVYDTGFRILAASDSRHITDPYWREYVRAGYCSYEYAVHVARDPELCGTRELAGAHLVYCDEAENRKIVSHVTLAERRVASVLLLECRSPFTVGDRELVVDVAQMVRDMIRKRGARCTTASAEDILYNLLEKQTTCERDLENQLRQAQRTLPEEMRILVFDLSSSPYAEDESALKDLLQRTWCLSYTVLYREHLVALCEEARIEQLAEELERFCRERLLCVGVGAPFRQPLHARDHYVRALSHVRLGRRAYTDRHVFFGHHTALFAQLPDLDPEQAEETYCHPALRRLRAYDRKNGAALYRTLHVYLLCRENVQLTAQLLYLHRNTLRNRIARALECGRIDLNNVYDRNDILMSYRIMQFYGCDPDQAIPALPALCAL